jgi:hypothetical protein
VPRGKEFCTGKGIWELLDWRINKIEDLRLIVTEYCGYEFGEIPNNVSK